MIPEVDSRTFTSMPDWKPRARQLFFEEAGCLVLRNAFDAEVMEEYNAWCMKHLPAVLKEHANTRHPKNPKKRVINDVMERMSEDNPALLMKLLNNSNVNAVLDALIGHAGFGAVTTHWNEPGGDCQHLHTDYPCHVKSGPFWEDRVEKLHEYFTPHQLEDTLMHFSVQTLIASDKMGKFNGSTEVAVGSHLHKDVDVKVHSEEYAASLEIENAELEQGDVLLFCRRLAHRGGKNISEERRNSLIIQHVWLMGVKQHASKVDIIIKGLEPELSKLPLDERRRFMDRIAGPFPTWTPDHN